MSARNKKRRCVAGAGLAWTLAWAVACPGTALAETSISFKGDIARVNIDLSNGAWVAECSDYRKPETCTALAYKATYQMPTTGEKKIPFELRMMLEGGEDGHRGRYKITLENGYLAEGLAVGEVPSHASALGKIGAEGRLVFWRRDAECSLQGSSETLPDGGVYCDFSRPLLGVAEALITGLRSGDASTTFDTSRLFRVKLLEPGRGGSELVFELPLEGFQALFGGGLAPEDDE